MSDLNKKNINYGALNRFYQDLKSHDLSGITKYSAGSNIQISNGVISATDTTYSAGSNISINGNNQISCTYQYSLPTASSSTKGGVKVGNGLSISNDVLSTDVTKNDISDLLKIISNPDLLEYPTIEALYDNTVIGVVKSGNPSSIDVSYDKNNWTTYNITSESVPIATINQGEKIYLKSNNKPYYHFTFSNDCYLYGNMMYLNGFTQTTYDTFTINTRRLFSNLFYNCTHLLNHPTKKILLPATTLARECYMGMFEGCTSLTTAPELPATTLAETCYWDMFKNCTSLTTAPVLPATTLTDDCYNEMFEKCTSLTTAPELPATTLAKNCYKSMFYDCSGLTTAPVLSATTLAESCYSSMFAGCSSLTTAPVLSATTLAPYCYYCMFYKCTSLTTAPDLPATTLPTYCYYGMFWKCSSLNSIVCLATDISAGYCTNDFLKETASSGVFYKNPNMSSWTTGSKGIPSGWTVQDYVAPQTVL